MTNYILRVVGEYESQGSGIEKRCWGTSPIHKERGALKRGGLSAPRSIQNGKSYQGLRDIGEYLGFVRKEVLKAWWF